MLKTAYSVGNEKCADCKGVTKEHEPIVEFWNKGKRVNFLCFRCGLNFSEAELEKFRAMVSFMINGRGKQMEFAERIRARKLMPKRSKTNEVIGNKNSIQGTGSLRKAGPAK